MSELSFSTDGNPKRVKLQRILQELAQRELVDQSAVQPAESRQRTSRQQHFAISVPLLLGTPSRNCSLQLEQTATELQIWINTALQPKKLPLQIVSTSEDRVLSIRNTPPICFDYQPRKYRNLVATPTRRQQSAGTWYGDLLQIAGNTVAVFIAGYMVMNAPALGQVIGSRLVPIEISAQKTAALETVGKTDLIKKFPPILSVAGASQRETTYFPKLNIAVAPLDNRIIIPKIGKNIPLVETDDANLRNENWKGLENDIQAALKNGVVHYPGTATPEQNGNFFITGHSSYYLWDPGKYKDVFARLHDLQPGDEYTVFWEQNAYHYRIVERKVVSPQNTEVLQQPTDRRISTLMTCTPVGTTRNRLILVAEPIT